MRGGGGEVKVVSVEPCGQRDVGWLAATYVYISGEKKNKPNVPTRFDLWLVNWQNHTFIGLIIIVLKQLSHPNY